MRRIRYQVACSLDGYIAGPNGEIDWIVNEPGIDFGELFGQFDTLLMGRRTFEEVSTDTDIYKDKEIIVFSRTLKQKEQHGRFCSHIPFSVYKRIDTLQRYSHILC